MFNSNVVAGVFESEKYWTDEQTCTLPCIKSSNYFVDDMTRLLFAFSDNNDLVLTKIAYSKHQMTYFNNLNIHFSNYVIEESDNYFSSLCVERNPILYEACKDKNLREFAVLPFMKEFCEIYQVNGCFPDINVIKNVNSKIYSSKLKTKLNLAPEFAVINDINQLINLSEDISRKWIIKEEYGVSGKGSYIIENSASLRVLIRHLNKQLTESKKLNLILEPFLDKKSDFSCQIYISKSGDINIISTQVIANNSLSYNGSQSPDESFIDFLKKNNYFEIIKNVSHLIYEDGYYGDVCIDSMVLCDNSIIPVVEINARKSMSLLKYKLEKKISKNKTQLCVCDFNTTKFVDFKNILYILEKQKILFSGELDGIMPLNVSSYLSNPAKSMWSNRLYFMNIGNIEFQAKSFLEVCI